MNIHRGTLIRFLLPKRIIWKIEKGIGDERCEKVALESMSLLIQRRILEGFKIVFEENGIINMIKEIPSEIPILLPKYEQFIIFPPTFYKMVLKGLVFLMNFLMIFLMILEKFCRKNFKGKCRKKHFSTTFL